MLPARDADAGPLPLLVALGMGDEQHHPLRREAQVLVVDRHQLGAPQRPGEADQEQCPVAQATEVAAAGGQQRLDLGGGQRRGRASGSAVLAEDAAQRGVDHRVPALPGMAQAAMLMGDRRQAAAQPAATELAGQARQIGRDDHRLGRQRGHAAGGAPGGEVGPVGGIGAPRVVGQRPAGVARRLRHRLANRTGEQLTDLLGQFRAGQPADPHRQRRT